MDYAKADYKDSFSKAFCIVCGWMEAYYEDEVWIMQADDENGQLVLYGDPEKCKEFQAECQTVIANCADPEDYWRV